MIPSQIIEEIRNKSDIITVVSEYVKLRKAGRNYTGSCPFHAEKNPSFTVSPEKQVFHCFGCGEGGNVFAFLMKIENIGFAEAVEELGSKIGIAVKISPAGGISAGEKEKLYSVMQIAAQFFAQNLNTDAGKPARDYLKQRGISETAVKAFGLGFALPGWDSLFNNLISRGAAPASIEKAGLSLPREEKGGYYDRFRNRLIFPVSDLRGRVIAFSGRSLGDEEPKYLNSPDTPIYRKGEIIYGLNLSKEKIKAEKKAVLVEGNLDLVSLYQAGFMNVAAPLGTALTLYHCKLLSRFADTIVLAFDADSAGMAAAEKSIDLLRNQGLKVKVAAIKGAKDPDELIRKGGAEAFRQTLLSSLPYLEFSLQRCLERHELSEIEGRSRALKECAKILSREEDRFVQEEYAKTVAARLKVDIETVLAEIKRLQFYSQRNGKDLRRVTEKPASKIIEAEKNLISLSAQNPALLEKLKNDFQADSFSLPETRAIGEMLFATDLGGSDNPAHFLLENLPEEGARKFLSQALVTETPEKAEVVFEDCLQVIKEARIKNRMESLKIELREAEKAGESEKAAELLVALKNEIK